MEICLWLTNRQKNTQDKRVREAAGKALAIICSDGNRAKEFWKQLYVIATNGMEKDFFYDHVQELFNRLSTIQVYCEEALLHK